MSLFRILCPSGPRTNRLRVVDASKEKDAAIDNQAFWWLAGLMRACPVASLTIGAGGLKVSGGEAWNDEDAADLRVDINHSSTGVYVLTAPAATAPDWAGVERPIVFHGALVTAQSATDIRGAYTLDSATQITVRIRNGAGTLIDCAFTVDIK